MDSNNVIAFPKSKSTKQPPSLEEISNNMSMIKHVHIGETLGLVAPMLFEQLALAGFDFQDEGEDLKFGAFVVEAIRAMLMRSYDMPHPFQEIAESVFVPDETGGLRIVDKLDIEFKTNFNVENFVQEEE